MVIGRVNRIDDMMDMGILRWADDDFLWMADFLYPDLFSQRGVSATGDVVVLSGAVAGRWTEEFGIEELPSLPFVDSVHPFSVSSDGRWTVGRVGSSPVRWDSLSPPQPLSFDTRWTMCNALTVNADGSRIGGSCSRYTGNILIEQSAALWTQETGMVSLQDLLVNDHGLGEALEGWWLGSVYDIADDGRFLVGWAINPDGNKEAVLVDLAMDLVGDFNRNGQLDGPDLDALSAVVREASHPKRFDLTGTVRSIAASCYRETKELSRDNAEQHSWNVTVVVMAAGYPAGAGFRAPCWSRVLRLSDTTQSLRCDSFPRPILVRRAIRCC